MLDRIKLYAACQIDWNVNWLESAACVRKLILIDSSIIVFTLAVARR